MPVIALRSATPANPTLSMTTAPHATACLQRSFMSTRAARASASGGLTSGRTTWTVDMRSWSSASWRTVSPRLTRVTMSAVAVRAQITALSGPQAPNQSSPGVASRMIGSAGLWWLTLFVCSHASGQLSQVMTVSTRRVSGYTVCAWRRNARRTAYPGSSPFAHSTRSSIAASRAALPRVCQPSSVPFAKSGFCRCARGRPSPRAGSVALAPGSTNALRISCTSCAFQEESVVTFARREKHQRVRPRTLGRRRRAQQNALLLARRRARRTVVSHEACA
jgi:hypothetical protein